MAFLSKLLWQKGFLLSSLNPHSQLQLPQFITHSTLTKMSQNQFLKQFALSLFSGFVPAAFLYAAQYRDAGKFQTQQDSRFNAIDTRLGAMDTRLDAMDTRLGAMDTRLGRLEQGVKSLSAQTTDCTADCIDAKRALLNYGLLPRRKLILNL
jgi:hypothetical protein